MATNLPVWIGAGLLVVAISLGVASAYFFLRGHLSDNPEAKKRGIHFGIVFVAALALFLFTFFMTPKSSKLTSNVPDPSTEGQYRKTRTGPRSLTRKEIKKNANEIHRRERGNPMSFKEHRKQADDYIDRAIQRSKKLKKGEKE